MKPGEIYLAKFPFGDVPGMKLRPVLVLSVPIGVVPEIVVAYISSVVPAHVLASDLVLNPHASEFRSTNLKVSSVLRVHKLATIHASSLARRLGVVGVETMNRVHSKLRDVLQIR